MRVDRTVARRKKWSKNARCRRPSDAWNWGGKKKSRATFVKLWEIDVEINAIFIGRNSLARQPLQKINNFVLSSVERMLETIRSFGSCINNRALVFHVDVKKFTSDPRFTRYSNGTVSNYHAPRNTIKLALTRNDLTRSNKRAKSSF